MLQNGQTIDLAMGWSHDIRTHLHIIKGAIGMIQSEKLTQEQSKEYTEMIRQNVSAMEKLINHLLGGKQKESALPDESKPVDVGGLLRRTIENVTPYAASRHVDLIYDVGCDVWIDCDPEMLERVILNILTNAVKCTDAGGVAYIHAEKSEAGVRVTVSDTGCGMSREQLDELREGPDQAVGAGYGLKLVKTMLATMNGRMECESLLNVGTTIFIYLPDKQPDATA